MSLPEKRRTVSRAFRIDEEWFKVLNEEAEREGLSTNASLNKILKDYAQVYRFSKRFGIVYLSYPTLAAFVNCCPKDRIIEIADFSASTLVKDGMRTIGLPMNYDSVTYFIKNIFGGLANWFICDHHIRSNKEVFHLRHSLGNKWSIFIAEVTSTMFKSILSKNVETEVSEGSVTITIERKRRPF